MATIQKVVEDAEAKAEQRDAVLKADMAKAAERDAVHPAPGTTELSGLVLSSTSHTVPSGVFRTSLKAVGGIALL